MLFWLGTIANLCTFQTTDLWLSRGEKASLRAFTTQMKKGLCLKRSYRRYYPWHYLGINTAGESDIWSDTSPKSQEPTIYWTGIRWSLFTEIENGSGVKKIAKNFKGRLREKITCILLKSNYFTMTQNSISILFPE